MLLLEDDNSSMAVDEQHLKKQSGCGGKDKHLIGNKWEKQLKQIEDMVEHLSNKLCIMKKELPEDKPCHGGRDIDDARSLIGQALNDLASMAHAGFQSWQQSMLSLEHASDSMKHQLADAQLLKVIKQIKKESLENDVTDMLMQKPSFNAGYPCTSSLSSPE